MAMNDDAQHDPQTRRHKRPERRLRHALEQLAPAQRTQQCRRREEPDPAQRSVHSDGP
jgi:hypothetical protein